MRITGSTGPKPIQLVGALAGVSLSLLLASCGGGDKTDSASSDSTGTASTTTTTSGATTDTKTASSDSSATSPTAPAASGDTKTASASDSSGSGSGATPDGWQSYTSEDGKYTVSFPTAPKTQSTETKTEGGGKGVMKIVSATPKSGVVYMVITIPMGMTPDKEKGDQVLTDVTGGSIASGTLVSNDKTTFQGVPAREAVMTKEIKGVPTTEHFMSFIVKDQIYQIVTLLPKADTNAADHKKFQDTFKLAAS